MPRNRSLAGATTFLAPTIIAWVESGPLTTVSPSPIILLRAAVAGSLTLAIAGPLSSVSYADVWDGDD